MSAFQFWGGVCRGCEEFCKPAVHNGAADPAQTTEFRNDNSTIKLSVSNTPANSPRLSEAGYRQGFPVTSGIVLLFSENLTVAVV